MSVAVTPGSARPTVFRASSVINCPMAACSTTCTGPVGSMSSVPRSCDGILTRPMTASRTRARIQGWGCLKGATGHAFSSGQVQLVGTLSALDPSRINHGYAHTAGHADGSTKTVDHFNYVGDRPSRWQQAPDAWCTGSGPATSRTIIFRSNRLIWREIHHQRMKRSHVSGILWLYAVVRL